MRANLRRFAAVYRGGKDMALVANVDEAHGRPADRPVMRVGLVPAPFQNVTVSEGAGRAAKSV